MDTNDDIPTFKLVLIGDGGVGKTSFCKRHVTGEFETAYIATVGADVRSLTFNANLGPVRIQLWDLAGREHYDIREEYYIGAQCSIIIFDVAAMSSYESVPKWYDTLIRASGHIPTMLVGNKVDVQDREVKPDAVTFHHNLNVTMMYCEVSVKSSYNIEKPFLDILRKVIGYPKLEFVAAPGYHMPSVDTDKNTIEKTDGS